MSVLPEEFDSLLEKKDRNQSQNNDRGHGVACKEDPDHTIFLDNRFHSFASAGLANTPEFGRKVCHSIVLVDS